MDFRKQLLSAQYPIRRPYDSEDSFFRGNRNVTGMAAADGAVVLNQHSGLTDSQQRSVALNEASRLRMEDAGSIYDFPVTGQQSAFFKDTPYGDSPQKMRHTIVARAVAGDEGAGPFTSAQKAAAESLLSGLLIR